jgi:hypothetical protein
MPSFEVQHADMDTLQRAIAIFVVYFAESGLSVKWNCGVRSPSLRAEFVTRPSR